MLHFRVMWQSDENLWYLLLCRVALSHDFKEMPMIFLNLLVCCLFYIHGSVVLFKFNPAIEPLFKINNRNTRTRCVIRLKLTITILERHRSYCSGAFIVNFGTRCSSVSYVYWEKNWICMSGGKHWQKYKVTSQVHFLRQKFFAEFTFFNLLPLFS